MLYEVITLGFLALIGSGVAGVDFFASAPIFSLLGVENGNVRIIKAPAQAHAFGFRGQPLALPGLDQKTIA